MKSPIKFANNYYKLDNFVIYCQNATLRIRFLPGALQEGYFFKLLIFDLLKLFLCCLAEQYPLEHSFHTKYAHPELQMITFALAPKI